ncbi:MAG: class I SAM-dependent methyltransferase [Oscillospiraceae bacterium]|nr:class I SAM-dependent methyltransferase [Oscillospiraceae bacterium]
MNSDEQKAIWQAVERRAQIKGWDFSELDGKWDDGDDLLPWDFAALVQQYRRDDLHLLDMDTGGGKFLLSLKHPYERTAATEGWAPNIALCKERLLPLGIDFREMRDPKAMPFADASFDLVLNRHGAYDAAELWRVLKPGGIFLTQQVGAENDRELVTRLLPDAKPPFPEQQLEIQLARFRAAGFEILAEDEAFRPIRFYDTAALIWFAKVIEWEFTGFSVDRCFPQLVKTEAEIKEKGAVCGSIHRYYFAARKIVRR